MWFPTKFMSENETGNVGNFLDEIRGRTAITVDSVGSWVGCWQDGGGS